MTESAKTIHPATWDHPRGPAAARILLELGNEHGLTAAECLAGTGLTRTDLERPDTFVEAGQELAIARAIIGRVGDSVGLGAAAGLRYTVGTLGVWGYAMLSSASVREAIRLGVRYAELSFAFIQPIVEPDGPDLAVVFDDAEIPFDVRDFFVERELTKIAVLTPYAIGVRRGMRVETAFTASRAAALRGLLPGVDLRTGAADHRVIFAADLLDQPLPQADSTTALMLEEQCRRMLEARRARRGIAARVRSLILAELDTGPTAATIAARLHMDERTLRRRLHADGTSFRELVDEVRSTLAADLLTLDRLTLAEIARRLGYHDAAGFSRAYRRWTGRTPRQSVRG
ncbi:helix-turn-helix domain-containing protein [Nocardia uniformis]|uniref:Helix-turn-helix domain-containing protein n=1 Tax=Nocardia uniformis TaxID=53432 RepID=A0A849BU42_9NOCA|nr:AraC family transcriptional regulator [Nocardia uniformis]NNH68518.1 helix-turn-helix domain-containing protein [Nocardia uniformis]